MGCCKAPPRKERKRRRYIEEERRRRTSHKCQDTLVPQELPRSSSPSPPCFSSGRSRIHRDGGLNSPGTLFTFKQFVSPCWLTLHSPNGSGGSFSHHPRARTTAEGGGGGCWRVRGNRALEQNATRRIILGRTLETSEGKRNRYGL